MPLYIEMHWILYNLFFVVKMFTFLGRAMITQHALLYVDIDL